MEHLWATASDYGKVFNSLGDVGGQIGLFVGASVLSYFQFLDCITLIIYAKFFQTFKPQTDDV